MKRALVLAIVCALGLGVAAFADAPLSGSWDMSICFGVQTTGNVVYVTSFDSNIGIAYAVSGWSFGLTMSLNTTGMDEIYFDVLGSLGAFTFASYLEFYPFPPAFMKWDNGASITLAGVNIYALFALQNIGSAQTPDIGAGWTLGGYGSVGDFTIAVESQFGLESTLADAQDGVAALVGGLVVLDEEDCNFTFSALEISAEFPFACFEPMGVYLLFTCTDGFDHVCWSLGSIDLGTWFKISSLDICFTVQTKTVDVTFELVLADTVCFVPYFSLLPVANPWEVAGISFDAFTIEYSWNGITFLAGHIFAVDDYHFVGTALKTGSAAEDGIDEFFAITAEGDSCCGGLWSASLINYFNSAANGGSEGIFDWVSTAGDLAFGIASNLSVTAGVQFSTLGLDEFCIGFEFTW